MKLELGQVYAGFKVLKMEHVEEVQADCYQLEHLQSGARLLYLDSKDDNKVFSIAFRTPPFDDSGVAHILEHSSLCGSRKYRLREPFVELAKGSLNTFLNAMTYPDKTVYPVASRNDKDFANLMDVYLDAVFFPLIYDNPYTLLQEGWHYEIADADSPLTYNGVVYNEMKGVYSAPDALLENKAFKFLFPDTPYGFESGGYPAAIPSLSQEKFLDFHRKYYSPENSYIYLYGNLDILAALQHLSEEYLDKFTRTGQVDSAIPVQAAPERTQEVFCTYAVDANNEGKAQTYHELSIVTANALDVLTVVALRLLENVLLETESGPLRRALVAAKLGQNVSGSFTSSLLQPIFAVRIAGSEPEERDRFVQTVYRELHQLSAEGIDRKLLEAALNSMEFRLREGDFSVYPKGLVYNLNLLEQWLYDGDPLSGLHYNSLLKQLRESLKTDFYEQLIETYLLDNTHKSLVTLKPEPGKAEKDGAAEAAKMAELKSTMSSEEIDNLVAECAELHRRQGAEDSPEALASIPVLQRSDIRREAERLAVHPEAAGENMLYYVPLDSKGIVYLDWQFNVTGLTPELLPYAYLYADIVGKLNTKRYSYQELITDTVMYTGGVSLGLAATSSERNADDYTVQFSVRTKVLTENMPKLYDILTALTKETLFDDLARFRELVEELKSDWDNEFFNRGMQVAMGRLFSYCSACARVNEYDGYSYYEFLKKLTADFEKQGTCALAKLGQLATMLCHRDGYKLFYGCEEQDRKQVRQQAVSFAESFETCPEMKKQAAVLPVTVTNEAIATPGKVQYVIAGGNFSKHGFVYTGAMRVLMTILSYEYLWTRIRVQGGAYGAHGYFYPNGLMCFSSYRDPQLSQSLAAYRDLPEWLRKRQFADRELDKFVIGTISSMDTPLTNSMKMDRVIRQTLKGTTMHDLQQERNQVLDVTDNDLRKLADVVEQTLSDGLICVVGGKQAIMDNTELFGKVINN